MKLPDLLFIDDELSPNELTLTALRSHFRVVHKKKPKEGLAALLGSPHWAVVIVDMMMPCPSDWSQETNKGQTTGLKILIESKNHITDHQIPVLTFTNRTLEEIRKRLDNLGLPLGLMECREKDRLSVTEIVEVIRSLAGKFPKATQSS